MNYVHICTVPTTKQGKNHHTCKHGLCLESSCCKCQRLKMLEQWKKGKVVAASSFAVSYQFQGNDEAKYGGKLFQHSLDPGVKPWKKANCCCTLLKRITRLKHVNSEIKSKIHSPIPGKVFPEGFMPPWRNQHESHTCSEQSLRILMWNAPYVRKRSNYTWQEWVSETTREGIEKFPSPMHDRLRKPYSQWSDIKWKSEGRSLVSKCGKIDMPVLGLAGRHFRKMTSKLLQNWCRYVQVISLDILRTP